MNPSKPPMMRSSAPMSMIENIPRDIAAGSGSSINMRSVSHNSDVENNGVVPVTNNSNCSSSLAPPLTTWTRSSQFGATSVLGQNRSSSPANTNMNTNTNGASTNGVNTNGANTNGAMSSAPSTPMMIPSMAASQQSATQVAPTPTPSPMIVSIPAADGSLPLSSNQHSAMPSYQAASYILPSPPILQSSSSSQYQPSPSPSSIVTTPVMTSVAPRTDRSSVHIVWDLHAVPFPSSLSAAYVIQRVHTIAELYGMVASFKAICFSDMSTSDSSTGGVATSVNAPISMQLKKSIHEHGIELEEVFTTNSSNRSSIDLSVMTNILRVAMTEVEQQVQNQYQRGMSSSQRSSTLILLSNQEDFGRALNLLRRSTRFVDVVIIYHRSRAVADPSALIRNATVSLEWSQLLQHGLPNLSTITFQPSPVPVSSSLPPLAPLAMMPMSLSALSSSAAVSASSNNNSDICPSVPMRSSGSQIGGASTASFQPQEQRIQERKQSSSSDHHQQQHHQQQQNQQSRSTFKDLSLMMGNNSNSNSGNQYQSQSQYQSNQHGQGHQHNQASHHQQQNPSQQSYHYNGSTDHSYPSSANSSAYNSRASTPTRSSSLSMTSSMLPSSNFSFSSSQNAPRTQHAHQHQSTDNSGTSTPNRASMGAIIDVPPSFDSTSTNIGELSVELTLARLNGTSPKIRAMLIAFKSVLEYCENERIIPRESVLKKRLLDTSIGMGNQMLDVDFENLLQLSVQVGIAAVEGKAPQRIIYPSNGRADASGSGSSIRKFECADFFQPTQRLTTAQTYELLVFLNQYKPEVDRGRFGFSQWLSMHAPPNIKSLPHGVLVELVQLLLNQKILLFRKGKVSTSPNLPFADFQALAALSVASKPHTALLSTTKGQQGQHAAGQLRFLYAQLASDIDSYNQRIAHNPAFATPGNAGQSSSSATSSTINSNETSPTGLNSQSSSASSAVRSRASSFAHVSPPSVDQLSRSYSAPSSPILWHQTASRSSSGGTTQSFNSGWPALDILHRDSNDLLDDGIDEEDCADDDDAIDDSNFHMPMADEFDLASNIHFPSRGAAIRIDTDRATIRAPIAPQQ